MTWVYIIIGLVVVIGLVYWLKSKKKEGGVDLSASPTPPETPPETPQPTETETEETPSDEEKPM